MTLAPVMAALLLASAWLALTVIGGMLVDYRDRIAAALRFAPIPGPRFREGRPVQRP